MKFAGPGAEVTRSQREGYVLSTKLTSCLHSFDVSR